MPKITHLLLVFYCFLANIALAQNSTLHNYWTNKIPNLWLEYNSLMPIDSAVAIVSKAGQFALIQTNGKAIIDQLDDLSTVGTKQLLLAYKKGQYSIVRLDGSTLIPSSPNPTIYYEEYQQFTQETQDGSILVYNIDGKVVDIPGITIRSLERHGYYLASEKNSKRVGLALPNGKWAIEPQFDRIRYFQNGYWLGTTDEVSVLLNPAQKKIGNLKFTYVFALEHDSIGFWGKKGYRDKIAQYYHFDETIGTERIPVSEISIECDYVIYSVQRQTGLWNSLGNPVLPLEYEYIMPLYTNNLSEVVNTTMLIGSKNKLQGLFSAGKWIVPHRFSMIDASDKRIVGHTEDSVFVYDYKGQLLHGLRMQNAYLSNNLLVNNNLRDSIYDVNVGWISLPKGVISLRNDGQYLDFIYEKNKHVIASLDRKTLLSDIEIPEPAHAMNGQVYTLSYAKNGLYGWYNFTNGFTQKPIYNEIRALPRGLFLVQKNLRWGMVNHEGKVLIATEYDDVRSSQGDQGRVFFKKAGIWKVFDTEGRALLTPPNLEEIVLIDVYNPTDNLCWGRTKEGWQLYHTNGKMLLPFYLTNIEQASTGRVGLDKIILKNPSNSKYGCIKYDGAVVLNFEWDSLTYHWGQKGDQITLFKPEFAQVITTIKGRVNWDSETHICVVLPNGQKQLFTINGVPVLAQTYQNINSHISFGGWVEMYYFIAQSAPSKWEVLDDKGVVLERLKADTVYYVHQDYLGFKKGKKKFLYNLKEKKRIPWKYESIAPYEDDTFFGVTQNGNSGLLDSNFNLVIPCIYANLYPMNHDFIVVTDAQDQTGVFKTNGQVCIPVDKYDGSPMSISDDIISVRKAGQIGIYSKSENKWTPASYEDIQSCNVRIPLAKALFLIRVSGKYGIMNADCQHVLDPIYDRIEIGNGFLLQLIKGDKIRLYDPAAQKIIGGEYSSFSDWYDYLIAKTNESKYAVYYKNTLQFERNYAYLAASYDNLLLFKETTDGPTGVLTMKGEIVLKPEFSNVSLLEGCIVSNKDGVIQLWDNEGQLLINDQFTDYTPYNYSHIKLKKGALMGLYDHSGNQILPVQYDNIKTTDRSDHFIVQQNNQFKFVYRGGAPMFEGAWDDADEFTYGLAAVKKGQQWGYINLEGNYAIQPQYQYADRFQGYDEQYTAVKKNGNFTMINSTGQVLAEKKLGEYFFTLFPIDSNCNAYREIPFTQPLYDSQAGLLFKVQSKKDGKIGLVNLKGDWVFRPEFDGIANSWSEKALFIVQKDRKFGLIDHTGVTLIPLIYDQLEEPNPGKFKAKQDGLFFLMDKNGNKLED